MENLLFKFWQFLVKSSVSEERRAQRGELPVCGTQTPKNRNLKNKDCLRMIISRVLHDLRFSRNQPLKSPDDSYIRILNNKLIKLKRVKH